jgi:hypothetical protein
MAVKFSHVITWENISAETDWEQGLGAMEHHLYIL